MMHDVRMSARPPRPDRLPVGPVFAELPGTLQKAWEAARDTAGLDDFRFHDLRHSAASYLAMSGASLMDIAAQCRAMDIQCVRHLLRHGQRLNCLHGWIQRCLAVIAIVIVRFAPLPLIARLDAIAVDDRHYL